MKVSGVSAIALVIASLSLSTANASDLFNPGGSSKDVSIAGMNLSGAYISLGAGGVFTDANGTGSAVVPGGTIFAGGNASLSGFLGDVRVGLDRGVGNGFLIGVYGDLSYEEAKGSGNSVPTLGITGGSATEHFGYGAGLKLGAQMGPTTVVYGLVGYQGQHISESVVTISKSTDLNGVLLGAGIETVLSGNWSIGAEGDYVAFGGWSPISGINVDADEIRTTARLVYHTN